VEFVAPTDDAFQYRTAVCKRSTDDHFASRPHLMSVKRLVVVGASAGGIDALTRLAAALPAEFPAAVCVVLHTSPQSPGVLDGILDRAGPLPAASVHGGERPQPGHIYVAPPDQHLVVEPNRLVLTKGPRENRFRPAIDPLFRSAAQVYGPAAVGVVLTGNLDDGTAGLWAIKQLGGVAIVQDPGDAASPSMPRSALQHVKVDHVVPLAGMAPLLARVVTTPVYEGGAVVSDRIDIEVKIAKAVDPFTAGIEQLGQASPYACPDCHGVLLRLDEEGHVRFRCHTGHAYSAESLLAAINERVEDALWNAVRAIDEGARYVRHLAEHLQPVDRARAERFTAEALEARRQSEAVRQVVTAREALKTG
jgi:two-component system, chemotaxis family, protein-glutamate methylesterase/glutaminase